MSHRKLFLTKKWGNLDCVAPSSVGLFTNYSFSRNVTVTFKLHRHRLVIQVCRFILPLSDCFHG
jgi:hypothetical protein